MLEKLEKKWEAQIARQGEHYILGRHTDRGFAVRMYDFNAKITSHEPMFIYVFHSDF